MKKLRLLVASLFIAGGAFAQVVGTHYEPNLTVTPLGATPNDVITITIDASTSCNDNVGGITGWSNANIHTGTILDTTMWSGWTNVVNWNAGPQTAFTETPSGSGIWKISFKPVDFYSVPTGIQGIAFVVNGGTSLADPSPWDHNARAFGDATLTNGTCGDFFVPFPIPAKLARTSGFAAQTERAPLFKQNVPNPFTGSTRIDYNTPAEGKVTVKIVNMLGEEVKTLVDGQSALGNHSVTWAGDAANGNVAPEGIYFVSIRSGNLSDVKKIVKVQ